MEAGRYCLSFHSSAQFVTWQLFEQVLFVSPTMSWCVCCWPDYELPSYQGILLLMASLWLDDDLLVSFITSAQVVSCVDVYLGSIRREFKRPNMCDIRAVHLRDCRGDRNGSWWLVNALLAAMMFWHCHTLSILLDSLTSQFRPCLKSCHSRCQSPRAGCWLKSDYCKSAIEVSSVVYSGVSLHTLEYLFSSTRWGSLKLVDQSCRDVFEAFD